MIPLNDPSLPSSQRIAASTGGASGNLPLLKATKEGCIEYLKSLPNQDTKSMLWGGPTLSPAEMAVEVERGTDVGKEILAAFIEAFDEDKSGGQQIGVR